MESAEAQLKIFREKAHKARNDLDVAAVLARSESIMNYYCEGCGFLFRRIGDVNECPRCESFRLRPATGDETEHLKVILNKEDEKGTW